MRNPEDLTIKYVGYHSPQTADELDLEILGLELAIKSAQQRQALLKQSLKLNQMMGAEHKKDE